MQNIKHVFIVGLGSCLINEKEFLLMISYYVCFVRAIQVRHMQRVMDNFSHALEVCINLAKSKGMHLSRKSLRICSKIFLENYFY